MATARRFSAPVPNSVLTSGSVAKRSRLARLLVLALGVLGFVAAPAPAAPHSASARSAPTGQTVPSVSAAARAAAQGALARSRDQRPGRHGRTEAAGVPSSRELAGATAPAVAAPPPTAPALRPSCGRIAVRTTARRAPAAVPSGAARGRAPPPSQV
ncbi:hypothetical protein [Spirillospora albida]|uniref:hypothetical protein n=1 Tax=Spirillospora albida TaxID=58123 RepID=UPI0004BFC7D9|nr:hypothetical protein [Spirillospora albida]